MLNEMCVRRRLEWFAVTWDDISALADGFVRRRTMRVGASGTGCARALMALLLSALFDESLKWSPSERRAVRSVSFKQIVDVPLKAVAMTA